MRHVLSVVVVAVMLVGVSRAYGKAHEARIPLNEGRLQIADLPGELMAKLSLPALRLPTLGSIDLHSLQGSLLLKALDRSMDGGCSATVTEDALLLRFDPDKLPRSTDEAKHDIRLFAQTAAPNAIADQQKLWGLHLPRNVDEHRPLTVLVHGLDGDPSNFCDLSKLLEKRGEQIAYFAYPSDEPLIESAALLSENLNLLHEMYPTTKVNVIAHSMGALVARGAIEGESYPGGVDRLILIAPPNHGSPWAPFRFVLELEEHYHLWRTQPKWRPSWMITDGFGEAGRDLKPGSKFLNQLNALPRRDGVRYTIIAGQRNPALTTAADGLDGIASALPHKSSSWKFWSDAQRSVHRKAEALRKKVCKSDGPVPLKSVPLDGVDDFVVLEADHRTLYCNQGSTPPAAWSVIEDRLGH
jgi:pimeloyl-ACP methyl ester carboxylesterase